MKLRSFFELYPIMLAGLFLGTLIGIGANAFVHEAGHYSFAYLFGPQNIKGFYFSPDTVWKEFAGAAETGDYRVEYTSAFPWGYDFWQAAVISFAGFAFQLALFFVFARLLGKYSRAAVRSATKWNAFALSLSGGLFLSSLQIMWSWWADAFMVLAALGFGKALSYILMALVSAVFLLAWAFALLRAVSSLLMRLAVYYFFRKAFSAVRYGKE